MSTQRELSDPFDPSEPSDWRLARQTVLCALGEGASKSDAVCLRAIQFALNRPRFPKKECALPESFHDPTMQKVEESMEIVEADYIAPHQYDAIRKYNVEDVELIRNHFTVSRHLPLDNPDASEPNDITKTQNPVENVENVESVEPAGSVESVEYVESVETVGPALAWDFEGMATGRYGTPGFWFGASSGYDVRVSGRTE